MIKMALYIVASCTSIKGRRSALRAIYVRHK